MKGKEHFSQKKNRIMLVDDHPVYRYGLSQLVNSEPDLTVCGEAEDAFKALSEIEKLKPDLVILDISLKGKSGIELIQDLTVRYKNLPILVLSMHDESLYAERVLHLGARGYIMKEETFESIILAIHQVLKGKVYVSQNISEKLLHKFIDGSSDTIEPPVKSLTNRELAVFMLIGKGYGTKRISQELNLSINTINTYRERIKTKLDLKDSSELIHHAIHWVQIENK
jgi:DNA-binding NarL/FixJ family response regulator